MTLHESLRATTTGFKEGCRLVWEGVGASVARASLPGSNTAVSSIENGFLLPGGCPEAISKVAAMS
jgi:hypothetical protein